MCKQISERKYSRISQDPSAELAVVHYRDSKDFYKVHEAWQAFKVGDYLYCCIQTKSGGKTHVKYNVAEGVPRKNALTFNTIGLANIW